MPCYRPGWVVQGATTTAFPSTSHPRMIPQWVFVCVRAYVYVCVCVWVGLSGCSGELCSKQSPHPDAHSLVRISYVEYGLRSRHQNGSRPSLVQFNGQQWTTAKLWTWTSMARWVTASKEETPKSWSITNRFTIMIYDHHEPSIDHWPSSTKFKSLSISTWDK